MTTIQLGALGTRGRTILGPTPFSSLGGSISSAGDFNGDGYEDFILARQSSGLSVDRAAYIIFGGPDSLTSSVNLNALSQQGIGIRGPSHNAIWTIVGLVEDLNGDGLDDVAVSFSRTESDTNLEAVYIIYGRTDRPAFIDLRSFSPSDGFVITDSRPVGSDSFQPLLGASVTSAGDINGDGIDDLAVSAPFSGDEGSRSGRIYIIYGKEGGRGNIDLQSLAPADGFFISGLSQYRIGDKLSRIEDFNGDGLSDLAISSTGTDAAYIVFGNASGFSNFGLATLPSSAGIVIRGGDGGITSYAMSSAGDFNADGLGDIIVSSAGQRSYIVFGTIGASTIDLATLTPAQGISIQPGSLSAGQLGSDVASAGDVNGDGYDDVVVADGNFSGNAAAFILFGKPNPINIVLGPLADADGIHLYDNEARTELGRPDNGPSLAAADLNGDGFSEVFIGARWSDRAGQYSGTVYQINGAKPETAVVRTGTNASQTLAGGNFDDVLTALGGKDELFGNGGSDTLDGARATTS